ncbi:MAG: class I SAM-dependent methyltransferase, partial [Polyangiales bacterium]
MVDPLAESLCGEEGMRIGARLESKGRAHDAIVARTCAIDERIAIALVTGSIDEVVLLGAGLDARPFRLRLPRDLRWTEVDLQASVEWKRARLGERKAPLDHRFLAADLSDPGERARVLDGIAPRSLVVIEGVLVYLERADVEALLGALRSRGARVIADISGPTRSRRLNRTGLVAAAHRAPFRTRLTDARGFFEGLGFEVLADVSLIDWDHARTDARWRRLGWSLFAPFVRDLSRVIDAIPAAIPAP